MSGVNLNDAAFRGKLRGILGQAMDKGGGGLVRQVQRNINVQNPYVNVGPKDERKRRYLQSSKPGEYPRKRSGTLQRNITREVVPGENEVVLRVGTNVEYGRYLETAKSANRRRVFLRRTMTEYMPTFAKVVETVLRRFLRGRQP